MKNIPSALHEPRRHLPAVRGFTLIELLTVIAILAAIIIPTVGMETQAAQCGSGICNIRLRDTATQNVTFASSPPLAIAGYTAITRDDWDNWEVSPSPAVGGFAGGIPGLAYLAALPNPVYSDTFSGGHVNTEANWYESYREVPQFSASLSGSSKILTFDLTWIPDNTFRLYVDGDWFTHPVCSIGEEPPLGRADLYIKGNSTLLFSLLASGRCSLGIEASTLAVLDEFPKTGNTWHITVPVADDINELTLIYNYTLGTLRNAIYSARGSWRIDNMVNTYSPEVLPDREYSACGENTAPPDNQDREP